MNNEREKKQKRDGKQQVKRNDLKKKNKKT